MKRSYVLTVVLGAAPKGEAAQRGKTPPLTSDEMAAIDSAMGKKGTYNEPQATYTVALPRNDLKVTVQGDRIPTPFGFGGWVSIKKTLDGKSCVLMSDTVLLETEVNGLVSAAHDNGLHPQTLVTPAPAHVSGAVQVPQLNIPPQPLGTEPQFFP